MSTFAAVPVVPEAGAKKKIPLPLWDEEENPVAPEAGAKKKIPLPLWGEEENPFDVSKDFDPVVSKILPLLAASESPLFGGAYADCLDLLFFNDIFEKSRKVKY